MPNDSRTLLDTSLAGPPPVALDDADALIVGRYRLLRPLGEGGMGNVYLAEDRVLARQVAIKTIRPELSGNEEVRSRIKREYRLHAAIGAHPNIVTLYDTVEDSGHIYLVMEYFAGQTLASLLASAGGCNGLPLDKALDIVRQILAALSCIHGRDIVHRDIKTSNILLRSQPNGSYLAKLTDFGIAWAGIDPGMMTRLTSLGVQGPGTPVYMAPERIDPQTFGAISPASDLYAVGIILFELLSGRPPFNGTMTEIFSGHLVQQPLLDTLPSGLPERLHAVLRTALAKQPGERYQDAGHFLAALADLEVGAQPLPEHVAPPPEPTLLMPAQEATAVPVFQNATVLHPALGRSPERLRRWQGAHPLLYAAAVVLIVFLGGYLWHHLSTPDQSVVTTPAPESVQQAVVTTSPPTSVDPAASATPQVTPEPPAKDESALQTVENARQQLSVEAAQPSPPPVQRSEAKVVPRNETKVATRSSTNASRSDEWQVTENRTRRIQ